MMSIKKLVAAAATALMMAPALANPIVTDWSYTLNTGFTGATFTPGDGTQSTSPTVISWGGSASYTNTAASSTNARSAIEITDQVTNGVYQTNDLVNFALGPTISHYNNTLLLSRATLSSASLLATLYLTPLNPAGPAAAPIPVNFGINFKETSNLVPNLSNCSPDQFSTTKCDDIFTLAFGNLNPKFNYNGNTYKVSIFELFGNLGVLSDGTCAMAGAAPGCIGFLTEEKKKTDAKFGFVITAVPEPATLGLLGAGLLGLGLARRRRKA